MQVSPSGLVDVLTLPSEGNALGSISMIVFGNVLQSGGSLKVMPSSLGDCLKVTPSSLKL